MGTYGSVACNCWKEGKAIPPPPNLPPEYIKVHEDGTLQFELPSGETPLPLLMEFDTWHEEACPHESMKIITEKLWGYRYFEEIRQRAEKKGYPALHTLLTSIENNEITRPDTARAVLVEIDKLMPRAPKEHVEFFEWLRPLMEAAVEVRNPIVWS